MISKKTVLILGAGASKPYKFPLGRDLTTDCISETHLQRIISQMYPREKNAFSNSLIEFKKILVQTDTPSIDTLLEKKTHAEFTKIGKLLILDQIHEREIHAKKVIDNRMELNDHWYYYLKNKLIPDDESIPIEENKLSIITFNYDRSWEYYFAKTYLAYYRKDERSVSEILKAIPIIHVNGSLGPLMQEQFQFSFGSMIDNLSVEQYVSASNNIRIWNEDAKDEELNVALQLLDQAENIFIIGFSFHRSNSSRLKLDKLPRGKNIIASYFDLYTGEMRELKLQYKNVDFQPLPDQSITKFFRRYISHLLN